MRKYVKIVFVLLLVVMIVMITKPSFAQYVPADDGPGGTTASNIDIFSAVKSRMEEQKNIGQDSIIAVGAPALVFIRNFALVLGVVMLSIIGIKYMLGSAEEKANYKKTLVPLVVGIIIVISATVLVNIVYDAVMSVVQPQETITTEEDGGGSGGGPDGGPIDPHLGPDIHFDDI